jgi:hypothetical protein
MADTNDLNVVICNFVDGDVRPRMEDEFSSPGDFTEPAYLRHVSKLQHLLIDPGRDTNG